MEQYGKYQHIIPEAKDDWWLAMPHMTPGQKNRNAHFVWYASRIHIGYHSCSCTFGIRPALKFAPSMLVEYGDGVEEQPSPDAEKALYAWYLRYVFDWANFNSKNVGELPLSYNAWRAKTDEQVSD